MKDHPFDTIGDVPVEARIVAWVLGEASAFEAAELERLCEERPELLVFRRRMLALHGLLTEAEAAEPDNSWKLPPEKRQALEAIFGEEKVTQPNRQSDRTVRHSARRALLATAACLTLTLIVAGLYDSSGPGRSDDTALIADAIEVANTNNLNSIPPTPGEGAFKVNSTAMSPSRGAGLQEAARQGQLARQPVQEGFRTAGSNGRSALPGPENASRMEPMPPIIAAETSDGLAHAETRSAGFFKDLPAPAAPMGLGGAPGTWTKPSSRAGRNLVDAPAAGSQTTRFPALVRPVMSLSEAQAQPASGLKEIPAAENPYSSFSLNVSDASFQHAKATLAKGERPDPASIEPEQFYNAVDYGDPASRPNEPVGVTIEQSVHPVISGRNLVRIAVRSGSEGRSAAQPLRLTLLVDQSASNRPAAVKQALSQLGGLLTQNDLVNVIGLSSTPQLLADGMPGDKLAKLGELVDQTASEGNGNLEEAMKLGGKLAERHQLAGAQNRIILFTAEADPARLAPQAKEFRQRGFAFDVAAIGAEETNGRQLSELARNGNGRYYVLGGGTNENLARQLAGAFRPAADHVKVQVIFNPQRVKTYKLIGFEKSRRTSGDSPNAAGKDGVALYQVEPLATGSGDLGEVSIRFRDTASQEMVERSWTIPYDPQTVAFDRATPSMQLAGLSMLAAEKLKGGRSAAAIDFKQLTVAGDFVKEFYGANSRVGEMLQLIEKLK